MNFKTKIKLLSTNNSITILLQKHKFYIKLLFLLIILIILILLIINYSDFLLLYILKIKIYLIKYNNFFKTNITKIKNKKLSMFSFIYNWLFNNKKKDEIKKDMFYYKSKYYEQKEKYKTYQELQKQQKKLDIKTILNAVQAYKTSFSSAVVDENDFKNTVIQDTVFEVYNLSRTSNLSAKEIYNKVNRYLYYVNHMTYFGNIKTKQDYLEQQEAFKKLVHSYDGIIGLKSVSDSEKDRFSFYFTALFYNAVTTYNKLHQINNDDKPDIINDLVTFDKIITTKDLTGKLFTESLRAEKLLKINQSPFVIRSTPKPLTIDEIKKYKKLAKDVLKRVF